MHLVKRTVNFDDPATYHFYFGDARANPGSLLTFFPWPTAPVPRISSGQIAAVSLAVPKESLQDWTDRARHAGIACSERAQRFGEDWISLRDPAGLTLELIGADVPDLRLHSATLRESDVERTGAFLTDFLGFSKIAIRRRAHALSGEQRPNRPHRDARRSTRQAQRGHGPSRGISSRG